MSRNDATAPKGAVHLKDGSLVYRAATWLSHGRGFIVLLALLALFAFGLRMAVSWDLLVHDMQTTQPSGFTDMWTYKDLAERIMKGEYIKEFYYQPFYYAVFLPVAHLLFGASAWAVAISQALAGAGAAFLAGLSAAMLFGRRAGVIATLLAALSAALLLYTPYTLIETSQSLWITLLLFLTLLAFKHGGIMRWGFAGLILAFSILTRGNSWIFAPGILAACVWSEGVVRRKVWRMALCLLALLLMAVLPQLPFALRNSTEKGTLCGPSTAAGAVLALGNSPEAPPGGRNPGYGPGPMEYPPTYQAWMENEAKRSIPGRIVDWIKSEPLAFAELSFRKALLFWDSREIPNNIAFEYNGGKSEVWKWTGIVPTGLIVTLALGGIIATAARWPRHPQIALPTYFITAYWAATVAFYILARFRVPIIPLLCVMAGGFVALTLKDLQAKRLRELLFVKLGALLIGAFLCYFAYDLYRYGIEAQAMRVARPTGVRVEVSEKETMLLDNGPETFGSWGTIKLATGTRMEKRFIVPKGDFKSVRLPLSSLCNNAGGIIISVNGETKPFRIKEPGLVQLEFELPVPADGVFSIEPKRVDAEVALLADIQRDYGRTTLSGEPFHGELVARVWFVK